MSDLSREHLPLGHETSRRSYDMTETYLILFFLPVFLIISFHDSYTFFSNVSILKGPELIEKANGLHGFMNWKKNLLTVSVATFKGPILHPFSDFFFKSQIPVGQPCIWLKKKKQQHYRSKVNSRFSRLFTVSSKNADALLYLKHVRKGTTTRWL